MIWFDANTQHMVYHKLHNILTAVVCICFLYPEFILADGIEISRCREFDIPPEKHTLTPVLLLCFPTM